MPVLFTSTFLYFILVSKMFLLKGDGKHAMILKYGSQSDFYIRRDLPVTEHAEYISKIK